MQLDPRKQLILRAIVQDYVETAEPVGSEALVGRYNFGVKSATLRNEMAEMAEMGYLRQPHTSAGRIPSDKGYRFYVDWLSTPRDLNQKQRLSLRDQIERSRAEVDRVLQQTCRLLSALTSYISMVTPPEMEQDVVRQVHLAALDRNRLLLVLALASGRVDHAVVAVPVDLMSVDLGRIERMVGVALEGHAIGQTLEDAPGRAEALSPDSDRIYQAVMDAVREALSRIHAEESGEVFVEGTSMVLRQPEFDNAGSVRSLMEVLEERRMLFSMLRDVYEHEAQVVIGSESPEPRMQMCSLVTARYTVQGRYAGTIGVLGPTRMDYDRTLPAVRFMANSLSEILTKLTLE